MRSTLALIAPLLLGLFFLIVGHGLQLTLIPLRAGAEGWNAFQIGAVGSAYYIGFVVGCIGGPYLIRRAGHIRAFTALVSLAATAMVAHPLWVAFGPWFFLRIVLGASLAGLYMIIESWLNDLASNETRGRIMSAYIMVNYGAIAVGQLAVTLYSPLDFALFAIAGMMMSLAAIPVALTTSAQPAPVPLVRFRPLALYKASPVGVVGVTAVGLANGAFWSLGAVAAVGAGLSTREAAIFMSIVTASGALAQWPAGRFSDRIDRRIVLIVLLCVAAAVGLLFAFLPVPGTAWLGLAVLFGVAMSPTYSIAAAHAYDHALPGTFVETAAGLFLANASGAIVGPLIASAMMGQFGTSRLFLFTALAQASLAAYTYLRFRQRKAPARADKTDFDQGATPPVGGVIAPEAASAGVAGEPPAGPPNEGGATA
jgi:MFS family permease